MRTKGDGNCLPHAVSLSLWGHEDDTLVSVVFVELCGEGMGNARLLFVSVGRPFDYAHLPTDSTPTFSLFMSRHDFLCMAS